MRVVILVLLSIGLVRSEESVNPPAAPTAVPLEERTALQWAQEAANFARVVRDDPVSKAECLLMAAGPLFLADPENDAASNIIIEAREAISEDEWNGEYIGWQRVFTAAQMGDLAALNAALDIIGSDVTILRLAVEFAHHAGHDELARNLSNRAWNELRLLGDELDGNEHYFVAECFILMSDYRTARNLAAEAPTDSERCEILADVAAALFRTGENGEADFRSAKQIYDQLPADHPYIDSATARIITAELYRGDIIKSRLRIERISDPLLRSDALVDFAMAAAKAGRLRLARRSFNMAHQALVPEGDILSEVYPIILWAQSGDLEGVSQLYQTVRDPYRRSWYAASIADGMLRADRLNEQESNQ